MTTSCIDKQTGISIEIEKMKRNCKIKDVLKEVFQERQRQSAKFGEQNYEPSRFSAVLTEEFVEALKEVNAHTLATTPGEEIDAAQKLRTELIQVSAVCVQWVESLDRNELKAVSKS